MTRARLFNLARALRFLPIVAIAVALIAVLRESFRYETEIPFLGAHLSLYSILIVVMICLLGVGVSLHRRRKRPAAQAPSYYLPPIVIRPGAGLTLEESALELQARGAEDVSREVILEGARVSHRPDLVFQVSGRTYIAEVKGRHLVPSDIANARLVLEDLKSTSPEIRGVFLVTPTAPSREVLRMAKSLDVEILVLGVPYRIVGDMTRQR